MKKINKVISFNSKQEEFESLIRSFETGVLDVIKNVHDPKVNMKAVIYNCQNHINNIKSLIK
jgi:hypothetical protein